MKTGIGLFWIAVGAILTFAVRANTSVFNLHIAGFVIMVIGIIGLATPKRGYQWLGRRAYVKRYRRAPGGGRVERQMPGPTSRTGPASSRTLKWRGGRSPQRLRQRKWPRSAPPSTAPTG
jgi:hypothetical protein